jgi:hypothetical protein
MSSDNLFRKYQGLTADEIISQLENQYKDDEEALESIERAKTDIAYIRAQKDYDGQTPKQKALECAGTLDYWN